LNNLSAREREGFQITLEAARSVPGRVTKYAVDLARVEVETTKAQARVNRAPEGEELSPLVQQLSSLQKQHGNVTLQLAMKAEQRSDLERDLTGIRREQEKIRRYEAGAQRAATRLQLAGRARAALDDYLHELTQTKVRQLSTFATECFGVLCRKSDLLGAMKINPETFEVTLLDGSGAPLPKSSLSAGEKQIYAIALLWGLAKVAGRPLPMIIDTPLGRLDSIHRQNLMERYFPVAAHQVIVLSTDTEVDKPYFQLLQKHVSHAIHLKTHEGQWSEIAEGYFWEASDERATA
jgi:DNA sulfur modification protein DndD